MQRPRRAKTPSSHAEAVRSDRGHAAIEPYVLAASFAVLQLQPLCVVTVTLLDPPLAEKESEVVETL